MTLSKRRAATLAAFAEALLPHGGPIVPSASEVEAPARLDKTMRSWDPQARKLFARALSMLDLQTIFSRSLRPFRSLKPEAAGAALARAAKSRWVARRAPVDLLKFYVTNEWASSPEVEAALGYDYGCRTDETARDAGALEVLQYP
ncbi:MAG: hypothetical protein LC663_02325, partial [Actinobacteria bacterium]|nr:hypothetical protein [Actinomycetota bacterium]